jgi:formyl-CoA transferase
VLVALHDRARSGEGRWVRTSLLEAMVAMLDFQATRWTVDGEVPVSEGNHHPTLVPMGCFRSADGYVNIAGPSGRLLRNFCAVVGLPELVDDPRFDSSAKRSANRAALNELVAERLCTRTTAEWVDALNAVGVPCGPVYAIDEVFADPQIEHLGLRARVAHDVLGALDLVRNAVTMTDGPPTVRTAAPESGADTDAVLAEIGCSAEQIAELHRRGIV